MEYFKDLYGVRADQEMFLKRGEEILTRVAERLMEVLDVELESCLSGSRGGVCWDITWDWVELDEDEEDDEVYFRKLEEAVSACPPPELDIHLSPNRIMELDDDYWREENYQEFAWLLTIGAKSEERIEETRQAIAAAKDLNLTLIRSTYNPDLKGKTRDVVTFSLTPETFGK